MNEDWTVFTNKKLTTVRKFVAPDFKNSLFLDQMTSTIGQNAINYTSAMIGAKMSYSLALTKVRPEVDQAPKKSRHQSFQNDEFDIFLKSVAKYIILMRRSLDRLILNSKSESKRKRALGLLESFARKLTGSHSNSTKKDLNLKVQTYNVSQNVAPAREVSEKCPLAKKDSAISSISDETVLNAHDEQMSDKPMYDGVRDMRIEENLVAAFELKEKQQRAQELRNFARQQKSDKIRTENTKRFDAIQSTKSQKKLQRQRLKDSLEEKLEKAEKLRQNHLYSAHKPEVIGENSSPVRLRRNLDVSAMQDAAQERRILDEKRRLDRIETENELRMQKQLKQQRILDEKAALKQMKNKERLQRLQAYQSRQDEEERQRQALKSRISEKLDSSNQRKTSMIQQVKEKAAVANQNAKIVARKINLKCDAQDNIKSVDVNVVSTFI
jgi:hypothetical protein